MMLNTFAVEEVLEGLLSMVTILLIAIYVLLMVTVAACHGAMGSKRMSILQCAGSAVKSNGLRMLEKEMRVERGVNESRVAQDVRGRGRTKRNKSIPTGNGLAQTEAGQERYSKDPDAIRREGWLKNRRFIRGERKRKRRTGRSLLFFCFFFFLTRGNRVEAFEREGAITTGSY